MSNIISFSKSRTEKAKNTIINNLQVMHHGKPVNYCCAVRGVDDFTLAGDALSNLQASGDITIDRHNMCTERGKLISIPLYRYNSIR